MHEVDEQWVTQTANVWALAFLILGAVYDTRALYVTAGILMAHLFAPRTLYPLGYAWARFSRVTSSIGSIIFLTLIYMLIVTPIGTIRRLVFGDELTLRSGRGKGSAFHDRSKRIVAPDLEETF